MLSRDPTYLGAIASVSGGSVGVHLAASVASGLSIIEGRTYRVGQVGSFVRIPQGYQSLFGVVSEVGAKAVLEAGEDAVEETGRWMQVQLFGEAAGGVFERGISQHPNIGDAVHIVTETDLKSIYGNATSGQIVIGNLSSSENISARVSLDELITRHSAVLGSTGSGKSTTVASLLQAILSHDINGEIYPSARILMLDIHGEYSRAFPDVSVVYSIGEEVNEYSDPASGHRSLFVPYWALNTADLLEFITAGVSDAQEMVFTDKIFEMKVSSQEKHGFHGVIESSITADTPIPFSLEKMWYDLMDFEMKTFKDPARTKPALEKRGDPEKLIPPRYTPPGMGAAPPFLNQHARGIRRQLDAFRSRLLDRRYAFLLRPGSWQPNLDGQTEKDLDELLRGWIGGHRSATIFDLSGVPSAALERLVGSILKIVYEALFWSREKSKGRIARPLLIVMEEAHRYLGRDGGGPASEIVERIVKEGRKYGVGAMIVSQRPSEVNETVLSQCGTLFALRLANPSDRERVRGILPDGLLSLLDILPILRTGEAIVMGEAAKLPMRCRVVLPPEERRPRSTDPKVSEEWSLGPRAEGYDRVVASWRAQRPEAVVDDLDIEREETQDES